MRTALFLNPPSGLYRRDERCQCKVDDQTVRVIFEPIELAIYAAIFERAGWRAAIRDYPALNASWHQLVADLRNLQPDFVLFVPTTATIEADLQVPALVKEHAPRALCVGKGDYFNIFGERILEQTPGLDLILLGEPDLTLKDLAEGQPFAEIGGVMFRDPQTGRPQRRPARKFLDELDSLPLPARHLLDQRLYLSPETGRPMGVIHAARGCPADCTFCNISRVYGKKIRQRSPDHIVAELESAVRDYGIREFLFHGDTFTYKKNWTIDVCKKIVERGLKIRWGCNSRVDTICPQRLEWMKRAGCWVIAYGVESGDQGILDDIKKGATVEQAREAARLTRGAGICVHAFMIIGMPNESRKTLEATERFARELDPDFFDFNIAYPLPGTELYAAGKSQSLFNEEILPHGSYAKAAIRTRFLSNAELTEWRRRALLRMYLRPRYIWRTLWRARSPNRIAHYVRAGAFRLRSLITAS